MSPRNEEISPKKSEIIRQMFSVISPKYDLANSVLSLGIHHLWRKTLVKWSAVQTGDQVLDCATGTGDLALEFEKKVGNAGRVTGTDFSEGMLASAKMKSQAKGSKVQFEWADVTCLPYPDEKFDVASISFGIRNVTDPVQGIRELGRVVRPGGRVMVLEFGQPPFAPFRAVYDFYSSRILPRVGGWISGQKQAYEYLQSSSAAFPCREGFLKLAREADCFDSMEYLAVSGGIAYIYKLTRRSH